MMYFVFKFEIDTIVPQLNLYGKTHVVDAHK